MSLTFTHRNDSKRIVRMRHYIRYWACVPLDPKAALHARLASAPATLSCRIGRSAAEAFKGILIMTDTSLTPQRFFAEKFGIAQESLGRILGGVLERPLTMGISISNISSVSRSVSRMGWSKKPPRAFRRGQAYVPWQRVDGVRLLR